MPTRVESRDVSGIDYTWVMQVTFLLTLLVGVPIVAFGGAFVTLPTWQSRAEFAIRVGAVVWLVTASSVYVYARARRA